MRARLSVIRKFETLVQEQSEYMDGEAERVAAEAEALQRKENAKLQWASEVFERELGKVGKWIVE